MNKLYVLCGPSGCGKSTRASRILAYRTDITLVSTDKLREELFGNVNDQTQNNRIFQEAYKRIKQYLKKGHVIFDATNLTRRDRRKIIKMFSGVAELLCIYPLKNDELMETCLKRNKMRARQVPEQVIRLQCQRYTEPSMEEGWDTLALF